MVLVLVRGVGVDGLGCERPARLLANGRGRGAQRVALLLSEGMAAFGSFLVVVVERDPKLNQYASPSIARTIPTWCPSPALPGAQDCIASGPFILRWSAVLSSSSVLFVNTPCRSDSRQYQSGMVQNVSTQDITLKSTHNLAATYMQ